MLCTTTITLHFLTLVLSIITADPVGLLCSELLLELLASLESLESLESLDVLESLELSSAFFFPPVLKSCLVWAYSQYVCILQPLHLLVVIW
jgi:hypothetical protein